MKKIILWRSTFFEWIRKNIFNLDNLLNKEQNNIAKGIYNIIVSITQFENCKINLKQHLINLNLEKIESFVYKISINKNIDVTYEILKKVVPTFPEELIASIFVSGFKEEKKINRKIY